MIQDIIDGISMAIGTEYDRTFKVYTESIEQGLDEPCFSIFCLNASDVKNAGTRRNRTYPFIIRYFPASDEPIAECLTVMESLYDLLSIIDVGASRLRGTGMDGSIVDGVLQFQVTYAFFLLASKAETSMEELEVNTNGYG